MTQPVSEPTAVGERLRWARMQSGLSQSQVAKLLDYHRPTISQIEAGQRVVRPDEIARLAQIYGIKETWIIRGDSVLGEANDPRIEIAARELSKLSTADLDAILRIIKVMRPKREEHGG